jgi:hypothetical protein
MMDALRVDVLSRSKSKTLAPALTTIPRDIETSMLRSKSRFRCLYARCEYYDDILNIFLSTPTLFYKVLLHLTLYKYGC